MREAFRQVLHSLLKPLAGLVVEELKLKLDPAADLDFSELRAGDIVGTSSRALGSLVKAGISRRRQPPRLWVSMLMSSLMRCQHESFRQ